MTMLHEDWPRRSVY